MQGPPFGPVYPNAHRHPPITAVPAADTVFTGQLRQTPDPLAPTVIEYVSTGQPLHTLRPATSEYVPAGHAVQSRAPDTLE